MLYPSLSEFNGNYTYHYRKATTPSFQGIINILLGKHEEGLYLLKNASNKEVDYYKAFAWWCLGDKSQAIGLLDDNDVYHSKLKSAINSKVKVLCQARNDGCNGWDITGTLRQDPEFEVVGVGNFSGDNIQLTYMPSVNEITDKLGPWIPDFYFVHMAEYKNIPLGIETLPYPIIFSSNDIQCQFPTIFSIANLCDAFITLGSQAYDLMSFSKTRLYTYPKMFGVVPEFAMNNNHSGNKTLDVFFSGNLQAPGLYDRTSLLLKFLEDIIHTHTVHITETKVGIPEYYGNMSRAKVVPGYIQQNQDSFSSRAIEAIASGSIAMIPEGNSTGIYFDRTCGLVEYTPCRIKETFLDIVNNWNNYYYKSALRGQSLALSKFNFKTIINHLFKFLKLLSIWLSENKKPRTPSKTRFTRIVEPIIKHYNSDVYHNYAQKNIDYLKSISEYNDSLTLQTLVANWYITFNFKLAGEVVSKILEKFPNDMNANLTYAKIYNSKEHYWKVINENLELNRRFPPILDFIEPELIWNRYKDRLVEWINTGNCEPVIKILRATAYINLFRLHRDNDDQARFFLNKSLELDPDNFYANGQLSLLNGDRALLDKSIEHFRYLKVNSSHIDSSTNQINQLLNENEKIKFIR